MDKVIAKIKELMNRKFTGRLTISFDASKIVNIKIEETITTDEILLK